MLKIRIQGTTNEIKWFMKILRRDKRFSMLNISDIFNNKGTARYKRAYAEIYRADKEPYINYNDNGHFIGSCGSGKNFSYIQNK